MKWYLIGIYLFITVISIPAAAIPILSVQPGISIAGIGDVFGVEIVIDDVDDLFAVDIDVIYDTSIMDLVYFAPGSFLTSEGNSTYIISPTVDEPNGLLKTYVEGIMGPYDGVSGSGILLSLVFEATSFGTGMINVDALMLNSVPVALTYAMIPGEVRIIPEPVSCITFGLSLAGLMGWRFQRSSG